MLRTRDILRQQGRHPSRVELTLPTRSGVTAYRLLGASNINDAHGTPGGVSANSPIEMLRVIPGQTYVSTSLQGRLSPVVLDQSSKGLTRIVYNPDDTVTTPYPAVGSGLPAVPPDTQTAFLRASSFDGATWTDGPIVIIPPYDFQTVGNPVIAITGNAPDAGLGLTSPPDYLDVDTFGAMNFHLPLYCGSMMFSNQDSTDFIWISFAPGTPPHVVRPNSTVQLTVGGFPELFVLSDGGNPQFSAIFSCVSRT
jgi:hypothetical protein